MKRVRFVAVVAAAVLGLSPLVSGVGTGMARVAGAASVDTLVLLECVGSARQDFDPALQLYPQQITVRQEGVLSTCLPNAHNIVNGMFSVRAQGRLDCLIAVAHSRAEFPIIGFTVRTTGQTVVIVTARVVAGLFAGHLLVHEGVLLQFNVDRCLLGLGVHTVGGPVNFTII